MAGHGLKASNGSDILKGNGIFAVLPALSHTHRMQKCYQPHLAQSMCELCMEHSPPYCEWVLLPFTALEVCT